MKKIVFTCMLYHLCFYSANSQEKKPLETDRPDQTETPSLVPKGMIQAETGFSIQKENAFRNSYLLPSVLWKYGINENFELRLITELAIEKNNTTTAMGMNPILIGFKIKISEEDGIVPKTSLISHISLSNVASSNFKTDLYAPEFRFAMQHTLSEKISLSYNLGAEWNGFAPAPTFIYTLAMGYAVTEKLGSYIEVFGFAPQENTAYHSFNGGFTYLINDNFMLDLSGGLGITENAPDNFYAIGFSFRL